MGGLSEALDRFLFGGQQEKAKKKTDGGRKYGPGAYLVVPDPDKPSTWKLRIEETPGKVTVAQLGRAAAALGPGFRGQRVQLSADERKAVAKKLIALYRKHGVDDADIPEYLWGIAGMKKPAKASKERNLDAWVGKVREAFHNVFDTPGDGPSPMSCVQVMDGYVVARQYEPELAYWKIPYTYDTKTIGGEEHVTNITFAPRTEWVPVVPVYSEIKVFKQADGTTRWLAISSGAFEDRDNEVVSTAFLRDAVKAADETGERGPLLVYHVPGAVVGECDYQAVIGEPGMLVESGTFADTEMGRRAAAYMEKHAKDYGMSIKFLFVNRTEDGVFEPPGRILERSILPREKAAFPWSLIALMEVEKMAIIDKDKQEELERILGPDLAAQVLSGVEASIESLKEAGIRYKEVGQEPAEQETTVEAEPESATEAAGDPEATPKAKQAGDETEQPQSPQEFQLVLPPDLTEQIAEKAAAQVAERLGTLETGLAEVAAALKQLNGAVAELARSEEERLQEKLAHLPRATVKAGTVTRPTQQGPRVPVSDNGQDENYFEKAKAVLYG